MDLCFFNVQVNCVRVSLLAGVLGSCSFQYVLFTASFVSRYFLRPPVIYSLTYWLFKNVLCHLRVFVGFPVFLLQAFLGDSVCVVPDHLNKANTAIKRVK